MSEPLLPIGSVVRVKDGDFKLIVVGFYPESDDRSYDYLGAPYPQGLLEFPNFLLFDYEQIDEVLFKGYIDKAGSAALDAARQLMNSQAEMNQKILKTVLEYLREHPELRGDDTAVSEQAGYTLG